MEHLDEFLENEISIPDDVEVTEPLKIYLKEIEQIPPMSGEEESCLLYTSPSPRDRG